ncbi:glycosyltransferase family 4 protein [Formosa algae]|uniref:Glycosyltransferase involved in cell wall biosynthesis n=2 Tax=Formosa algae TaxID=225843 RepID=A0A9X0YML6_9FLAO|nr:glycosyltransferase family 4 protein [Formosa algae]MBP1841330.1 glycosyltransferase involved in cell wall biosynthesis [Formosa algae]MDQ0336748.1 glycosyltransferase involved in cell wall biosynthesis [Formosa algae]
MKKNVLYLGNNLSSSKTNVSYMKGLSTALKGEGYSVLCKSAIQQKLGRVLDMVKAVLQHGSGMHTALIDTYSTQNFYYAVIVSQCCRLMRLPYIPILHGGNLPHRLEHNPRLCRLLFRPAKVLVSPSLYLKTAFTAHGFSHVVYIPNSLQLQQYPFTIRPVGPIRLLWVRSFSTIYNPCLAVDILKSLLDQGYEADLCMVGPDTDGSLVVVRSYAEQLGVAVTFTGKLSKPEWTSLAADYNVFINTTNFDNMPVSVIEAMALGLPIVSTNVGGMPFLIADGVDGVLVPPNDCQAFVDAILDVKSNPEKTQQLVLKAREKVEGFDWEVVKAQWREVLE